MLVRTRQEYACTTNCFRQLRRAIWDGDQLLYEIAAPGESGAAPAVMERDTGLAPNFKLGFYPTGRVEYVHGAELDAPLAVYRAEYSDSISGGYYVPLANWKGSYDGGYSIEHCYTREWSTAVAPPVGPQVGGDTTKSNATSGTEELCPTVEWPAQHEWAARQYRRGYGGPRAWMGSLIYGQRDFSGLHYRRNRFYDAEQGRFTQEDPIGLAGGINLYGFAKGDPVSYSDPYGLCAKARRDADGNCPGGLSVAEWRNVQSASNNLKPEARTRALSLLYAGKIHGENFRLRNHYAEASWDGEITFNRTHESNVYGTKNILLSSPGFLGTVLAHEIGHVVTSEGVGGWERFSIGLYNLLGIPTNAGIASQRRADGYARRNLAGDAVEWAHLLSH